MFKLLMKLKYFDEDQIRQRLATLQQIVGRDVAFRYAGKVPRLHDIIVTYLDGPGKSGFQYAKLYGEENKIFFENIQEPPRALKSARNDVGVKALIFIDDFLGTGQSAIDAFAPMRRSCFPTCKDEGDSRISMCNGWFSAVSKFSGAYVGT